MLGASWGLIASPFSMGLYSGLFHPLLRANSRNDGLVSALLHGTPGYEISVALGLMKSHNVVENAGSVI